jgi:signal transduction histidine kinase
MADLAATYAHAPNALASPVRASAVRPAVIVWGTHLVFWGVYLAARTAAAEAFAQAGWDKPETDFPLMLNRTLVVTSFMVMTGALLLGVMHLRTLPRWAPLANLALVLAGFALMPAGQVIEEFWPRTLHPMETTEAPPLIAYVFEMGWVLPLWAASQALIGYHLEVLRQNEDVERARALAYDAHVRALHYQINPHFLFNTLNAISTLVLDRRNEQAEAMLLGLSSFLRYSLDRNPTALAPLSEELAARRQYLAIEQARFGDKLRASVDVDASAARGRVPSLILQPILENAIKHAVAPRQEGGAIEIAARRDGASLRIRISDDGPGLPAEGAMRRGVGLANARERLALLHGERAGLSAHNRADGPGCVIEIWLPFEE